MKDRANPSILVWLIVAFCLIGTLVITGGTALGLASFREVGYPELANVMRTADFVRDGHIYPDSVNRPPYLATLYGPLTYVFLSVPYRFALSVGSDPVFMIRLTTLAAFCACITLLFLISRYLSHSSLSAALTAVFALSSHLMTNWPSQIRCDFLALTFSLAAVYLFLRTNGTPRSFLSAIAAGVVMLVKQTFAAAPLAILCWLVFHRRYKEATYWTATFASIFGGGWLIIRLHEPRLAEHLNVLRHPSLEFHDAIRVFGEALAQPAVPFAVVGVFLILSRRSPETHFLPFYWLAAWTIGCLTIPQQGGGISYFWESLFVSSILAGPALLEVQHLLWEVPKAIRFLVYLLVLIWLVPTASDAFWYLKQDYLEAKRHSASKSAFESFLAVVKNRPLLSTYTDLTMVSKTPQVPDPGLNTILENKGVWSYQPVIDEIDHRQFQLVVMRPSYEISYRGLRLWDEGVFQSLHANYKFSCVFQEMQVWLPNGDEAGLLPRLSAVGCAPPTQ